MGKYTELPMPVICECGFSTMDAKEAYRHAMKHQSDEDRQKDQERYEAYLTDISDRCGQVPPNKLY